jgi:hypothetical protein
VDGPVSAIAILVEIAGWGGAGLILLGYLLISLGKLDGQSAVFQWINVFGGAGFVINAWWHGAVPVVALNLIWVLIGAVALIRIWSRRARAQASPE